MRAEDEAVPMVNITFFTHDTALDVGGAMAKHYKHADEARTHTRTHRACTRARATSPLHPREIVRSGVHTSFCVVRGECVHAAARARAARVPLSGMWGIYTSGDFMEFT